MASDLPTKLRNLAYDARAFETDNENQPGGFMLEVAGGGWSAREGCGDTRRHSRANLRACRIQGGVRAQNVCDIDD